MSREEHPIFDELARENEVTEAAFVVVEQLKERARFYGIEDINPGESLGEFGARVDEAVTQRVNSVAKLYGIETEGRDSLSVRFSVVNEAITQVSKKFDEKMSVAERRNLAHAEIEEKYGRMVDLEIALDILEHSL